MSEATYPVAILAGGLATRLQPLTVTRPKALVDINGEPFIAHQVRLLRRHGVERAVICVGYLGALIEEQVGDGAQFGLRVTWSFDGPKLLGTAGAIAKALPLLGDAFFVIYGDSYLPGNYRAVQQAFVASRAPALMTVFRNDDRWDRSNVECVDGRILAYDKERRTFEKNVSPDLVAADHSYAEARGNGSSPDHTVGSLAEAAAWILSRTGREGET